MKIYLATSFSTRLDSDGRVHPDYQEHIDAIISALERKGLKVFCAVKHQDWIVSKHNEMAASVKKDLDEVQAADCLLAILHEDASRGVQYEMGYAAGLGKQVIVATEPGDEIAYFNQGLIDGHFVKHIVYKNAADLAKQI